MTAILLIAALALSLILILVSFVQILYLESMRFRTRDFPALQFFKEHLEERFRMKNEQGVLSYSLIKQTSVLLLGLLTLGSRVRSGELGWMPLIEAILLSWAMMILCAYIIPQVLYRHSSGAWTLPFLPLLKGLALLVRPLTYALGFLQSLANLGNGQHEVVEDPGSSENIEALISAGTEEGILEEGDRKLIQSVVEFGDKTVREVMTARPNIVAIDENRSLQDLRTVVVDEQYSRVPVYRDGIDQITGFVHVRDMFELDEKERAGRPIREIRRPVRYVPETKPVHDLLREMQRDNAHMAIVVDEYGNTAGLVTMEDLVEEILGEIRDEHEPGDDVTLEPGGAYVASGNLDLDRLQDLLEFRPEEDTESTTLGGLVTEWLGRVPFSGEVIEREGIRIEVLSSNQLRVEQVRVSRAA